MYLFSYFHDFDRVLECFFNPYLFMLQTIYLRFSNDMFTCRKPYIYEM